MRILIALAAACAATSSSLAQEAMYTEAATMPSPNTYVLREQFTIRQFGSDPSGSSDRTMIYELLNTLQYGLARDLSLTIDIPVEQRTTKIKGGGTSSAVGVPDLGFMLKYRFYKDDTGGVDTIRAAALFGADIASGDSRAFSSGTVNPRAGAVVTMVRGRHGFNQDLILGLNTGGEGGGVNFGAGGPSESVRFDTSYLFRIAPDRYTSDSVGAWYVTTELNGLYETNGDVDIRWAPGFMYEGRRWGFEVMAQLPFYEHLRKRPELDWGIGIGIRLLF